MVDIKKSFNGFYKNKKILVTGHTGFKGSWLTVWLNELGANIIGYSLKPDTKPNNFELSFLKSKIKNYFGNVKDKAHLKKVIFSSKPEIIFHLAAQPLVIDSYKDPVNTYETNIMGLVNLFEIIRQVDFVKCIVVITSDKCYLNKEVKRGYVESDSLGGLDPYSASKSCAEIITASYYESFLKKKNIFVATGRAGNVIGGGDWSDYRLIPDCMKAFSENKKVILRNPYSVRPWQFVLEPLSGYLTLAYKLMKRKSKNFSSWNFGPSNKPLNVYNIVKKVSDLWGLKNKIEIHSDKNNYKESNYLFLSIEKAKRELNWKPLYNLDKSLEKTVEWYKKIYNGEKNVYELCKTQIEEYVKTSRIK